MVNSKRMSSFPTLAKSPKRKSGLAHWMRHVLKECDNVLPDLAPDPVHDLRVALRRCRSMADGLRIVDSDKGWKHLKKSSKPIFQSLGELRDLHVMQEWIEKLGSADDQTRQNFYAYIKSRETDLKHQALQAVHQFDRKQWKDWCRDLPSRAARIRIGSPVFKHLALERWTEARKLQAAALRTESPETLHRLRIGLKRFRYTVENFLPLLHTRWSDDLKDLQDMLGEIHDLDVLWQTALTIQAFPDAQARTRWHQRIIQGRQSRIQKYREKMTGPHSLWNLWRSELPRGPQIQAGALKRMELWASFLDPNFQHAKCVAQFATRFFDDLTAEGIQPPHIKHNAGAILHAAAFMHDVGRSRREKNHHKKSSALIRKLSPPLGWSATDLNLAATVARYHRGNLPQPRHKAFRSLSADQRANAVHLAAILRFVDAIARSNGSELATETPALEAKSVSNALRVFVTNYSPRTRAAESIAAARHLLEVTLRRPVIVQRLNARKPRSLRSSKSKSRPTPPRSPNTLSRSAA
jgi:CHAD domain-containing protein